MLHDIISVPVLVGNFKKRSSAKLNCKRIYEGLKTLHGFYMRDVYHCYSLTNKLIKCIQVSMNAVCTLPEQKSVATEKAPQYVFHVEECSI